MQLSMSQIHNKMPKETDITAQHSTATTNTQHCRAAEFCDFLWFVCCARVRSFVVDFFVGFFSILILFLYDQIQCTGMEGCCTVVWREFV